MSQSIGYLISSYIRPACTTNKLITAAPDPARAFGGSAPFEAPRRAGGDAHGAEGKRLAREKRKKQIRVTAIYTKAPPVIIRVARVRR